MENITLEKKSVFISYCHKDVPEEWIDKLATALGQYGINTIADIYDLQLEQDLNYFMEQIKRVDKVLILLGKTYKEKANDREGGVGTETQIISNDVYNDVEQTKFIPMVVSKDENGNAYLPYYLEGRLYTDFSDDNLFAKNIEVIARQIHKLPKRTKPVVVEPPISLIKANTNLGKLIIKEALKFEELAETTLQEMENIKCTSEEFKAESDEAIIKKIEESKEIRDFFVKSFVKMIDDNVVDAEDIISFLENAYSLVESYKEGAFYECQNDGCRFFLQEVLIYIIAVLYKKRKYKIISQLIRTTYFPNSSRVYVRQGINIGSFYFYLKSLDDRNSRSKLNRKSIHADLLMQRAYIKDVNICFEDIRFADCLILMLSEWYYKGRTDIWDWYPVTIIYSSFGGANFLQLKKYLVSKSRFHVIHELFGVDNNQTKFMERYNELATIVKEENRRVDIGISLPAISTIVKKEELFTLD